MALGIWLHVVVLVYWYVLVCGVYWYVVYWYVEWYVDMALHAYISSLTVAQQRR